MGVSLSISAKRKAPEEVTPITTDRIRYTAPQTLSGFIEARDVVTNQLYWMRQIYVVKYNINVERDIQDCFITRLEIQDQKLLISNEEDYTYSLDLNTLEVKAITGTIVIDRKETYH